MLVCYYFFESLQKFPESFEPIRVPRNRNLFWNRLVARAGINYYIEEFSLEEFYKKYSKTLE